jgi:type IV pilus assembly protein PilA
MKNFNFNLLQYLNNKKAQKGFTLIELLVVIIIIGILSAIALPAFLNQASKAKQSEAKQALGAINRGQQAYRLENVQFAPLLTDLALGVDSSTNNYIYKGENGGTEAKFVSIGTDFTTGAQMVAESKDATAVRDYASGVIASADTAGNATTTTALCEEAKPEDALADLTVSIDTSGATDVAACDSGKQL